MGVKDAWSALWGNGMESKESAVGSLIALAAGTRDAIWTPRDFETAAKESYEKNIIAFRCIRQVATSAASCPWRVRDKTDVLDEHPLLELWRQPNPMEASGEYIEKLVAWYLITGQAYLEAVAPSSGPPQELWTHRPDRMKVVPGQSYIPGGFVYSVRGKDHRWEVDPLTGASDILHLKTFNPTNDWYGMSPLEAAAMSIDIHNDTLRWNKSLIQNDARPPGVMVYAPKNGPDTLGDDQRADIIKELEKNFMGKAGNKRPMILEGGLEWRQLGLSPKDMDFILAKNTTATDICMAFGVPTQLIGLQGSLTFANYEEARLAFWEDTVIPLLYTIRDEVNNWLSPRFGDNISLECDLDGVSALSARRKQHFDMIQEADYLTVNEKRKAMGWEDVGEAGDVVMVSATMVPLGFTGLEATETPEAETAKHLGGDIEYKLLTAPTAGGRAREAAIQLRLADAFERRIAPRLVKLFDARAARVSAAVSAGRDPEKAMSGHAEEIAKELGPHYIAVMTAFGSRVLEGGKELPEALELKDAESEFTARIAAWVQAWGADKAVNISTTTKLRVRDALAAGEEAGEALPAIAKRITATVGGQIGRSRALLIARTETHSASVAAGDEALSAMGLQDLKREWIAVEDDMTRTSHLKVDGQKRKQSETFLVGKSKLSYPGDPAGAAQEVINCRCILAAVI
jgi:HK97 family phage portal protein